jgi:prolyl-tRNA synthetase
LSKVITKRSVDYAKWYTDLVLRAELADYAPVKGCMVIRPYGYALWERMQAVLDGMFKETGHKNAYFPLFIPESFMKREAEHVEGFAPQCAVVTHGGGEKLEEPLYVRPTSETVIWHMYGKWIQSYRDLPLLVNQWCNIVRWEMRTRLFLRTTEFLWQEGHTAHATEHEAREEAMRMLEVYTRFAEDYMAVPVVRGKKTEHDKFPGAVDTLCIEAMMQDGRALQAGTSHYLGQNFAKAFNVQFQNQSGQLEFVYATSWGVSTRLIGALIMVHSDDDGLVLPPKLAPIHAVIVPIWKGEGERETVLARAREIKSQFPAGQQVYLDDRDNVTPGWKFNEWELKGVPVRIELGPRDVAAGQAVLVRRDIRQKTPVPASEVGARVASLLDVMQSDLFQKAVTFREKSTRTAETMDEFTKIMEKEEGFVWAHWCREHRCEDQMQQATQATVRCLPFAGIEVDKPGRCLMCGNHSPGRVLMAKAY